MTGRPKWPVPAGRDTAKAAETTSSRAAALEAQVAALSLEMTAHLADMIEATACQAAALCDLKSTPPEVRQLAERVLTEIRPRAASLRQVANLTTTPDQK